jgi:hypothetical protein
MPSVSNGMSVAVIAALFAASGPATPFDRAGRAELLLVLGELLLGRVAEEGRDLAAARRDGAERKADRRRAQPRRPRALPLGRRHVHLAHGVLRLDGLALVEHHVQRLADREQADRDEDHLDAVHELGNAARVARLAGDLVDADQAHREADRERRHAAQRALAEDGADRREGQHHQHEVLGRAELDRERGDQRREQRHQHRGDRAGDERADRRGREGGAGAAVLGHLVAFHRRHHRARFAGVLSRMDVVEPPYIAP